MIAKELKFSVNQESMCSIKEAVRKVGGILICPRTRELNTMYDDYTGTVGSQRGRLCLQSGANYSLSYERALSQQGVRQDLVLATKVGSMMEMKKILLRIGFRPVGTYARHRTTWDVGNAKVSLCEFLFGTYLEISGETEHLFKLVEKFGFALRDGITASYDELYRAHRIHKIATPRR
jgi:adenylate cyclase class IV